MVAPVILHYHPFPPSTFTGYCCPFVVPSLLLLSLVWITVAIKSIHHPVWPVTCLMKLWFRQVRNWAVTNQKFCRSVSAPVTCRDNYISHFYGQKYAGGNFLQFGGFWKPFWWTEKWIRHLLSWPVTSVTFRFVLNLGGLWPVTNELI